MPAAPASLIVGDLYLVEEKTKSLIQILRSEVKGEVSLQSFKLTETPLDTVITASRSLPFFTDFQIFRVQEVQALKEKKLESLTEYLNSPSPTTAFIFEAISLDKDHPLVKLLNSKKAPILFLEDSDKKGAGARLVREKLRKSGKTLAPGVLERLEEQAGDAPALIDSVLNQLILYAADHTEITEEMADRFQENWKEPNIFTLTEALVSMRKKEALVCLKQILEQDDKDVISLIGLLHWQIRRFWQARVLLEDGVSQSDLLRKVKVSPKQAPFFMRQLQSLSRKKLEESLEGLFQLDWGLKSGRAEGAVDLEKWVIETTDKRLQTTDRRQGTKNE